MENPGNVPPISTQVRRVFISEPLQLGWIIEKLMRDLANELERRGLEVTVGPPRAYSGQEVVLHSRYLYADEFAAARVNSLFITHVDDRLKELELKSRMRFFNSFVCLSQAEAEVIVSLGCPREHVVGIPLPHRGGATRRPRVAYFSARYDDGRKNEEWLIEYFENRPQEVRNSMIICLLGYNWESFCARLASLGLSFELYRYDRRLPGEYERLKYVLEDMDYLIYPGFDGGAMCIYDGIVAGLALVISDVSYHRDLGTDAKLFRSKAEFFEHLDQIAMATLARDKVMSERTIGSYADRLVAHWNSLLSGPGSDQSQRPGTWAVAAEAPTEELQFYRSHYKPANARRLLSALYRQLLFWTRRLTRARTTPR